MPLLSIWLTRRRFNGSVTVAELAACALWRVKKSRRSSWNNIPKKLQRELFDNAGSMGDLLSTKVLRGKVARFLHKHKDDVQ